MDLLDTSPFAAGANDSAFDWPAFGLEDDVRPSLKAARASGTPAVLATLFHVVGGAPRGVGAQMLFAGHRLSGFLSGGCIEADVAVHAERVAADGVARRVVYGDGGPADIRLACGSRIEVLLERLAPDDPSAARLLEQTERRRPCVWLTDGSSRACVDADEAPADPRLGGAAAAARHGAQCGHAADPFAVFRRFSPPLRLIIVGGEPIALAVGRLALEMGVETTLVRPKGPMSPPFATLRYLRDELSPALGLLSPDPWTAIAVLTHDLDQEHEALMAALASPAGYVGALGSRRRIPERQSRLLGRGLAMETIERVRAPIGLPIGGKSPWEIAVSILAEIVETIGGAI